MIRVEHKGKIDINKLKNLDLTNAMELIGITVENNAKLNSPVDTGALRRSLTHEVTSKLSVEVGTNLEYAPYVEFGTGIYAKNGDGRKTPWTYKDAKGEWHTTRGQKPQEYLTKGLEDSKADIETIISNEIRRQLGDA